MDDINDQSQTLPLQDQSPSGENSPTPSQKKIVRLVLIIFSVVFFIVVAILGIFAYLQSAKQTQQKNDITPTLPVVITQPPTESDIAEWSTFISEDFGISVKYPPDWEKKEGQSFENGDLFGVMIMGETQREGTELYDGAIFAIATPIKVEDEYKIWAKDYYTRSHLDESQPLEFSTETINGVEYLKVYTCGLGCFTYYITEKDNYVYQVMVTAVGPGEEAYQQTIDKIIATLVFEHTKIVTMPSPPPGALSFSSPSLGIGFFYPQKVQNIQSIDVKESGNKAYVFMTNMEPEEGQSVEVFSKNPDDSLSDAISKHFLAGKEEEKCFVTTTKKEGTITTAIIDFPEDQAEGLEGMSEMTAYCSEDYAKTNGIRYFWYDSEYPSLYLFFNIGQYGIPVSESQSWQDTVMILKQMPE